MGDDAEKSDFVPEKARSKDHAPLGPTELETLERLVLKGEMLQGTGTYFYQLTTLIAKGYAGVKRTYRFGGKKSQNKLQVVVPTSKGNELAYVRRSLRTKREG